MTKRIPTDAEIAAMLNVLPEVAGLYLDKTPQYIRVGLQRERLPFGTAVQGRRWSYSIPGAALVRYKYYGYLPIDKLAHMAQLYGTTVDNLIK